MIQKLLANKGQRITQHWFLCYVRKRHRRWSCGNHIESEIGSASADTGMSVTVLPLREERQAPYRERNIGGAARNGSTSCSTN